MTDQMNAKQRKRARTIKAQDVLDIIEATVTAFELNDHPDAIEAHLRLTYGLSAWDAQTAMELAEELLEHPRY